MPAALAASPAGAGSSHERHDSTRISKDILNFKFRWYEGDWSKDTLETLAAVTVPDTLSIPVERAASAPTPAADHGPQQPLATRPSQFSIVTDIASDVEAAAEWLKWESSSSASERASTEQDQDEHDAGDQDDSSSVVTAVRVPLPGGDNDGDEIDRAPVADDEQVGSARVGDAEAHAVVGEVASLKGPEGARKGDGMSGFRRKWEGVVKKASTMFHG
ncbi:hypothetical protein Tdes44962_MAKER01480 [Teratosphaeria destructans]|uniref:Uncharacterized protein n=1 Tax=Teratosphaeria destructans TaxID=418781 RepID=A0A9W7SZC3_9PEZI|nr:hypothetical protein Tdes44962_MAKER01480 [Teratosphaeria destructans]